MASEASFAMNDSVGNEASQKRPLTPAEPRPIQGLTVAAVAAFLCDMPITRSVAPVATPTPPITNPTMEIVFAERASSSSFDACEANGSLQPDQGQMVVA